ncbi:MAG TPA: molybdenum cofactor guanylyltransferase [Nitrospirae bacterium]|nr:putative molybdenum cofactor guanylyltransferase [bacterium BMS3Abin09]GBE41811.1 putative molybdenum cofactor guanylyltransferase [bacterium BMS3Bbin09]HDH34079.1 molybdenum cofactor guanylyltransferase [Nitrospirota bacterium]HDN95430.1 molybdenum cofactor guanylyltransferase [Nitrospirota bacterium]HDO67579.1 molybdenum cofactor guanylyltransferase [Nitrospirota bacterium]
MNDLIKDCTGVILAGGENTRMPVLKAFIKVNGEPIIEKNLALIQQLFEETFIVTNQPEEYSYLGAPLFGDIHNIRGPMTGIFTSLINSSTPWVFISACDMPFINKELINYMNSQRKGFDAVVPASKGKAEPLFAFYSKKLLSPMEKAVLSDRRGLKDFLKDKKVKYISAADVRRFDPGARSFINMNTPGDADQHLGLNID